MCLTCLACGERVETQHRDLDRAMRETKYRPIFPEKGVRWLCSKCAAKAEEHAAALLELLKGEIAPLWHLVSEKRRLKIVSDNAPDTDSAETSGQGA